MANTVSKDDYLTKLKWKRCYLNAAEKISYVFWSQRHFVIIYKCYLTIYMYNAFSV